MQDMQNIRSDATEQLTPPNAQSTLCDVYRALSEKGYDPVAQIVGYLLTEDPTYITNHNNARGLIRKIDRDELLNTLVKNYLEV